MRTCFLLGSWGGGGGKCDGVLGKSSGYDPKLERDWGSIPHRGTKLSTHYGIYIDRLFPESLILNYIKTELENKGKNDDIFNPMGSIPFHLF